DTACTADVTGDKSKFSKLFKCGAVTLRLADNSALTANHSGAFSIQVDDNYRIERANVKYVPGVMKSLLSYRQLLLDGFELVPWDLSNCVMIKANSCIERETIPKLVQRHLRLAHLNFGAIKQVARSNVVDGLDLTKYDLVQESFER
ncbi:hypothetical protein DYB32_009542, partial [Aphanomyces invadans]